MTTLFARFLTRARWLCAAVALALCAAVMWGMQYASMEATYRSMLAENDPYTLEVERSREHFPPTQGVLFVFQGTGGVFEMPVLRAMDALTSRFTEIDSAISAGSLMNRRLSESNAERLDRDYLFPPLDLLDAAAIDDIRRLALDDEDLTKTLLAPDGSMALANVKFRVSPDDQATRLRIAESVVAFRDALRAEYPQVEIYTLGGMLFERDGVAAQVRDRTVLMPLVMGASILLLWLCLRSLPYALALFAVSLSAIGLTTGTWGWLGIPFNQISSLGPLVVFVVAVAHGIHIVAVYAQGLHKGLDKLAAMQESLVLNLQPVSLATVTTAMGFLGLNFSSSPGIYGFGNVIAIGTGWAYLMTLLLLPSIILLLPTHRVPRPLAVRSFIDAVERLVLTRGRGLLITGTAVIVATLALLPLNRLDFNRYSFVDEDSDFHHILEALREKIGNDQSLVYSIDSGSYYGITEPAFLEQVDRLSQWLEAQPEATFVASYTDYLRARNKDEHDDDAAYDVVPEDQLQIIDYLVGYQLVQEIEPSLEPIFNADYSVVRLAVGTSNLSNGELVAFNDRIETWIDDNLEGGYDVLHGDYSILFARLDHATTVELMQGFAVTFLLITLTMLIGLKSVRYGLISIAPNLFPATIVFGLWGVFQGELSPYILMLFSISIGIVVDDSVHVLSKYISALRDGATPDNAVRHALDRAGSAITITTLSLAVGTFLLVFSNTFHFQNVALMITPIIIVALLLDLLFLPPLLLWLDRRKHAARSLPFSENPSV